MTFDFNKLVTIGSDKWKTAPFRFYGEKEPFFIGNKIEQDWREITLKGVGALSLVNAKKDGLTALKLFGSTEQNGTPTPDTPIDIVSNNGVIKWDSVNQKIYTDGTVETVGIDTTGDTATAEMLLSVGNYQDVQSVLDGVVTRNVGIKVLDGTETWVKQVNSARYGVILNDSSLSENLIPISSHFVGLSANTPWTQMYLGNCKKEKTTSTYYFQYDTITTIQDWKQWLQDQYAQGTPVIVVYPLAEPTTETVTPQPLSIQAGTNIITAEGSIDNLPLEVSYKAGVSVTITEVQNAQLDNNVEVIVNG